jgi:hypothetical protein
MTRHTWRKQRQLRYLIGQIWETTRHTWRRQRQLWCLVGQICRFERQIWRSIWSNLRLFTSNLRLITPSMRLTTPYMTVFREMTNLETQKLIIQPFLTDEDSNESVLRNQYKQVIP